MLPKSHQLMVLDQSDQCKVITVPHMSSTFSLLKGVLCLRLKICYKYEDIIEVEKPREKAF
jgi:hypothetical protein